MTDLTGISIETPRLRLRPARLSDAPAVARFFNDPEIVRFLMHDASSPEKARAIAERWCGTYGDNGPGSKVHDDGLGLFLLTPRDAAEVIGFCGICHVSEEAPRESELFYGLARDRQGRGLMTEAASALLDHARRRPEFGPCFATYWDLLNPISGRLLSKLGFVPAGRRLLAEDLGEGAQERLMSVVGFELWRLAEASSEDRAVVAEQAATKIGHIAGEGVLAIGEARDRLAPLCADLDVAPVEAALARGFAAPGMAKVRLG